VGLEDWELARIRVNILQRAGAQDLLERLSLLSPLPGHSGGRRSGDSPVGGSAFQKIFSKRSARTTRPLQRWAERERLLPCSVIRAQSVACSL